jgi:hypothetical protein
MATLKTIMKRNEGLVGHLSVAEALELDPDDVAEWADGAELPCVDGVRVFTAEDVNEFELCFADDEDDEEFDSVHNPGYGPNRDGTAREDVDETAEDLLVEAADDAMGGDDDDAGDHDDADHDA